MPGQSFGSLAYPLLVAWTFAIVGGTYMLMKWAYGFGRTGFGAKKRLLLAAAALAMIMVMAS